MVCFFVVLLLVVFCFLLFLAGAWTAMNMKASAWINLKYVTLMISPGI